MERKSCVAWASFDLIVPDAPDGKLSNQPPDG